MRWLGVTVTCCLIAVIAGCVVAQHDHRTRLRTECPAHTARSQSPSTVDSGPTSNRRTLPISTNSHRHTATHRDRISAGPTGAVQSVAFHEEPRNPPEPLPYSEDDADRDPEPLGRPDVAAERPPELTLDDVLGSVYDSYPMLRVALEQRTIADGDLLAAQGEFDFKVKGGGTSGPLGFYETNRFGTGFEQALFGGGQAFAGYRIGRGSFQPWYGERETNDGGEFKAGVLIPLLQNRRIDPRRATIFRTALGRDAVEPDILVQLIDIVRAASYAYLDWVAAGQDVQISQSLLAIAQQRQVGMQSRVDHGDLPRIELTDNERLIVSRQATLVDAQRKFQQSAIKLSLFLRTPDGQPLLIPPTRLPDQFPAARPYHMARLEADIQTALAGRPELQFFDITRAQIEVDLRQARNTVLPEMDVGLVGSQDVGPAASIKRDKTPFELEATVLVSVPLQRRKALGKIQATQGKLAQVQTKTEFMRDKIATDVRSAIAALNAAYQRIEQTRRSVELNLIMEQAERSRFDQGDSNLLVVNLREQATADARKTLVAVLAEYHRAEADYRAALAAIPIPGETLEFHSPDDANDADDVPERLPSSST